MGRDNVIAGAFGDEAIPFHWADNSFWVKILGRTSL